MANTVNPEWLDRIGQVLERNEEPLDALDLLDKLELLLDGVDTRLGPRTEHAEHEDRIKYLEDVIRTQNAEIRSLKKKRPVVESPYPLKRSRTTSPEDEKIAALLKAWNNNRCHHFVSKKGCKFANDKCYSFHSDSTHAVVAKHLRIVMQAKGDISASSFFQHLVEHSRKTPSDFSVDDFIRCVKTACV